MEFSIKIKNETFATLSRKIGYKVMGINPGEEANMVRDLSGRRYPRFHIYIKRKDDDFLISLHIDQKFASYEGSNRHSGEYDGEVIEQEAERIRLLTN
ncbi:hypothetical protein KKG36_02980 [Patescibacteria group bacterium]|nr:hypothetical protein [Patescibacteria group bacterium]